MSDILNENLLLNIQKGQIDDCKKVISQGANVNYTDSDGNSAAVHAVLENQIDCLRFLITEGIDLTLSNTDGNTALHIACEKENKEMILVLLVAGADPAKKNNKDEKPGAGNTGVSQFLKQVSAENKAFTALNDDQKKKLRNIFKDICKDAKHITLEMSKSFNMYVDDVEEPEAEKDAKDFIESCAICNKEKVDLDEWIFAFAKLWVCDQAAFQKFIEDYEGAIERKGPFYL